PFSRLTRLHGWFSSIKREAIPTASTCASTPRIRSGTLWPGSPSGRCRAFRPPRMTKENGRGNMPRPFHLMPWCRLLMRGDVEAVGVHHLGPPRPEVLHELLLRVRASVDFREGAELRVRAEDQVDAGGGPLERLGLAIAALVGVLAGGDP